MAQAGNNYTVANTCTNLSYYRCHLTLAATMRFKLTLHTSEISALLPFNYQYPLSAAIYKIIHRADAAFAGFLHNEGYTTGNKSFKLFTFSDIQTPFEKNGDRMLLTTGEAALTICFYMPKAAETFIKGLFMHQQIEIADYKSKITFIISSIETVADTITGNRSLLLQPLSPLVTGRKNERGHYNYHSPEDADFTDCLVYNWLEKWMVVHPASEAEIQQLRKDISLRLQLFNHPPQQRLITIKAGTTAETKVRGYTRFRLAAQAPAALLQLALGAGLGLHNAQGFGCMAVV